MLFYKIWMFFKITFSQYLHDNYEFPNPYSTNQATLFANTFMRPLR